MDRAVYDEAHALLVNPPAMHDLIVMHLEQLWEAGASVRAFDPVAMKEARHIYGERKDLQLVDSAYEAAKGADALMIATEWQEFRSPDFDALSDRLASKVVFDGRNLYDPAFVKTFGLRYFGIGRGESAHPATA